MVRQLATQVELLLRLLLVWLTLLQGCTNVTEHVIHQVWSLLCPVVRVKQLGMCRMDFSGSVLRKTAGSVFKKTVGSVFFVDQL